MRKKSSISKIQKMEIAEEIPDSSDHEPSEANLYIRSVSKDKPQFYKTIFMHHYADFFRDGFDASKLNGKLSNLNPDEKSKILEMIL